MPIRLTQIAAAVCTLCFAATSTCAHAEDDAPIANTTSNQPAVASVMQKVTIKGSAARYDARRDDTASKTVVNSEEIQKYGDTSVNDVLKRVPGITVGGAAGRGGGEIRMRGLGAGYTQILINGEKAPAGFSIDNLAPDVIERIEVLRAASAEFSTQSIAGTINIVLKKAVKTAQRELKLGYGKGNALKSPTANLQLSDRSGQLSYSLSANFFRSEFFSDPSTVQTFRDAGANLTGLRVGSSEQQGRFTGVNLAPRLNWTFANGDTLTGQTFVNIGRFRNAVEGRENAALGPLAPYPALDQAMSNDIAFYRQELNWVHKLGAGGKLDAKLSLQYGDVANDTYRTGFGNPAVPLLYELVLSDGTDRSIGSQGKYLSGRFEGHALAFGWDGGYSTRDDARRERDYRRPDLVLPGGDESYEAQVSRLAVYGQDEWNVTPRWSVYLGARWEGIRIRTSGNTFDTARSNSSVFSPLLQTLYKLPDTKGDQLRLAVTRTYKAPNVQSLIPHRFTSVNNSQTEPDSIGNPKLKPELALGIDAAYEHYWAEGALLSASVSTRRIQDYTRNLIRFDGARWVSSPTNAGNARTYGLELEAKFPLKALIQTTTALDLRASVSRNWSTVDSVPGPDNRLDAQTPLSATLGADYKKGALTLGGSYVFKNGGPVRISLNQLSYQSVRRDLDLYGLWKFDPKLQLRVSTANLLGQDYITESSYADAGGSQASRTLNPIRRSVRANLEMKF